jgi:hypothetical protein
MESQMRDILLVFACLMLLGCAPVLMRQPALSDALRLEMYVSAQEFELGVTAGAKFLIRNVSTSPVEFCQLDGGVSVFATRQDRSMPLRGYGSGLDVGPCYARGRLMPAETREINEDFPVFFPEPGPVEFRGSIRIHTPAGDDHVTLRSAPVPVTIRLKP